MSLNIHTIHFDADEKLLSLVKDKIAKIYKFNDTITSVDVYLKLENMSQHIKNKIVEVKVNLSHKQIFDKKISLSFEEALSSAIKSSISQLKSIHK